MMDGSPITARRTRRASSRCCSLLATLWGASYSFIKLGVATIPPITLIAARTLIAGVLLLVIMRWRGVAIADGCRDLAAFPVPGLPQQRDPLDADRLGRAFVDAGLATILNSTSPIFTFLS